MVFRYAPVSTVVAIETSLLFLVLDDVFFSIDFDNVFDSVL